MPRIERTAEVVWEGNVARGNGSISGGTGAFTGLEFSLPTRIGAAEGKTSPEELLAAAHGACITMSLASELTQAGTPPGRLAVTCLIVMDEVEGQGHQIVGSNVELVARVDGIDDAALQAAAAEAHAGCPFSQLLERAGATVTVTARLAD
jgi:lipoyl-dependent peroxiredoxin